MDPFLRTRRSPEHRDGKSESTFFKFLSARSGNDKEIDKSDSTLLLITIRYPAIEKKNSISMIHNFYIRQNGMVTQKPDCRGIQVIENSNCSSVVVQSTLG